MPITLFHSYLFTILAMIYYYYFFFYNAQIVLALKFFSTTCENADDLSFNSQSRPNFAFQVPQVPSLIGRTGFLISAFSCYIPSVFLISLLNKGMNIQWLTEIIYIYINFFLSKLLKIF